MPGTQGDLVHQLSTSTGTGNFTLSAVNGKRDFGMVFGTGATTNVFDYYISNRDAAEWERGTGHMSNSTTLVRDTVIASSNSNAAVSFSAGTKDVTNDVPAGEQLRASQAGVLVNGKIVESHASNAATFAIKGLDGNDPSSTNPVVVIFGDGAVRTVTAATSVTASSGSTLGASNGIAFRLWFCVFDDSGTVRLGMRNCMSSTSIIGFPGHGIHSSTAEGGAGAADSAQVTYTGTAVSSKQFVAVAFADYESGLTTAGTWAASPTRIQSFRPGMRLPGDAIGAVSASTSTRADATTSTFVDSAASVSVTLTSPCNAFSIFAETDIGSNAASLGCQTAIRSGGVTLGKPKQFLGSSALTGVNVVDAAIGAFYAPGDTSSHTIAVSVCLLSGTGTASIAFANGGAAITVTEVMG